MRKIQDEGLQNSTKDQLKILKNYAPKKLLPASRFRAGKTTEALAFYAFHKLNKNTPLLVISPPSAFISWEDEIEKCFSGNPSISRLKAPLCKLKKS